MVMLRLAKLGALWATVAVFGARAYMQSQASVSQDARQSAVLLPLALALVAGHAIGWLAARRRPERWAPLGSDRLALSLLVVALCVTARSATAPHTSIKVLLERIPPILGWLYPTLAFLVPLALRRTGQRLSAAHQGLLLALAFMPLSGALVLMEGSTALCLGLSVLLMQLASPDARVRDDIILRVAGAVVALLTVSAYLGLNRLQGMPSLAWILASAAVGLAVACRPRSRADGLLLVAAPVVGATLVAACGVLVTIWLGENVAWMPALHTRLTLFRQHPNFLAPFFAFHALLALGLAVASTRGKLLWVLSALLLAASTVHTTSRAGIAGLAVGLAVLVVLGLAPRVRFRPSPKQLRLGALGAVLLSVALVAALALDDERREHWAGRAEGWLERSFDYRLDAWRNTGQLVAAHPWLGVGPHTFLSVERFKPGSRFFNERQAPHPHNAFLYVALAAGLPALLLFLIWTGLLALRLARPPPEVEGTLQRSLRNSLLAACCALLLSNLLDLGMALDTVVPSPLFLITGLLAAGTSPAVRRRRPITSLAWSLAVFVLLVPLGLDKLRARARLDQALMLSALSASHRGDKNLMYDARWALRRAIALDPDLYPAYKLLAAWVEAEDREAAHGLLQDLIERAPVYGPSHSLLGHLYLRAGRDDLAAEALLRSFNVAHGGVLHSRDRAAAVTALARLGRREQALGLLTESLRLDAGILDAVPWIVDPATGGRCLPVADRVAPETDLAGELDEPSGDDTLPLDPDVMDSDDDPIDDVPAELAEPQAPITIESVVEALFARNKADHEAGRPVGRRFWFDTYNAFRHAGDPHRALDVLDYLETNVPDAEPAIVAFERGQSHRALGQLVAARGFFTEAFEHQPNPHFLTLAAEVGRELGDVDGQGQALPQLSAEAAQLVFLDSGEILDQPPLYQTNLETQASIALQANDPAEAARLLSRTLVYLDALHDRAERWRQAGELWLEAGDHEAAAEAFVEALAHFGARPASFEQLRVGYIDTLPSRLARNLCAAWHGLGLDDGAQARRVWSLPHYPSARLVPSLFRLTFLAENGRPDALLREADMLLRHDPGHVFAMWSRLDALEGLGRYPELPAAMRTILATLGRGATIDRRLAELEATREARLEDPAAWTDGAVLIMLKGRYGEASDLFGNARRLLTGDDHWAAHLAGWQARSLLLSDRPGRRAGAKRLLQEAARLAPTCGSLRLRLETMP